MGLTNTIINLMGIILEMEKECLFLNRNEQIKIQIWVQEKQRERNKRVYHQLRILIVAKRDTLWNGKPSAATVFTEFVLSLTITFPLSPRGLWDQSQVRRRAKTNQLSLHEKTFRINFSSATKRTPVVIKSLSIPLPLAERQMPKG